MKTATARTTRNHILGPSLIAKSRDPDFLASSSRNTIITDLFLALGIGFVLAAALVAAGFILVAMI